MTKFSNFLGNLVHLQLIDDLAQFSWIDLAPMEKGDKNLRSLAKG